MKYKKYRTKAIKKVSIYIDEKSKKRKFGIRDF